MAGNRDFLYLVETGPRGIRLRSKVRDEKSYDPGQQSEGAQGEDLKGRLNLSVLRQMRESAAASHHSL